MNLAKVSANGQITVPAEIRRLLGLKSGDKILFFQNPNGEVVINNASAQAIYKAQKAFDIHIMPAACCRCRRLVHSADVHSE